MGELVVCQNFNCFFSVALEYLFIFTERIKSLENIRICRDLELQHFFRVDTLILYLSVLRIPLYINTCCRNVRKMPRVI